MFMHACRALKTAYLAADHDGGGAGVGDQPAPMVDNNPGRHDVLTVDDKGRSTEEIVDILASIPVELARLIDGKSDDDLTRPANDGGWGLVEILPHFRDWELIIGERVTVILEQDAPSLEEYDDSLWAIEHEYREQQPREALREFTELRNALTERLQALEPADWNRIGILPKQGRVTLHWLTDSICNHDAKHLVQARDVLA
jgi:hypothetical protein